MDGIESELRQHAAALRALALRLVGSAHADDLVQEASLLACTQRPDERGGLGSWLRSVLRHRAGKLRRSNARRTRREQAVAHDGAEPSPLDVAAQREAMAALHGALMALPAPYQGVLLQRFFQDLTPTAIAANHCVPLATVKSQLQRGLALLRERLDADWRPDWRTAFAGAFALSGATMLMSTKVGWLAGCAAAALLCVELWPDAGTALPAAGNVRAHLAVANAADVHDAANEPMQRTEAVLATTRVAPASAPSRVRIVDAFDGAPLPGFCVQLDRAGVAGHTMTITDDRGELEIDGAWRGERVELFAVDDARAKDPPPTQSHTIRADQWPTDGRCLDVPFAVGPTFRLAFDTPPPDDNLDAELIAGADSANAQGLHRQAVRPGSMPWVRFSAANANPSELGDGPWTLVVSGSAWTASGAVAQVRGAQAAPVLLHRRSCGWLQIEVTIDSGPLGDARSSLSAAVFPVDDAGKVQNAGGRQLRGDLSVELAVGKYRVFVGGPDRQEHHEDIVIEAATTRTVHADFRAGGPRFTLQVVLRSQTGKREVSDLPVAWRVGVTELVNAKWAMRRDDGAQVYELSGLSPGEWDVEIGPTPHLPPWDSTTKRVSADAGTVEFVCLDAGAPPRGHGRFRVVDAATEQPIEGAGVTTVLDGTQQMAQTGSDGIADLGECLAGQPVRVLVRAAGHAPAWFEFVPLETDPPVPHEVALRPGWGTLLMVVRPGPRNGHGLPLPGVRVLVDGVFTGTTDGGGLLLLSTNARPARIELQHREYVHAYGGIDRATGAPDSQAQVPFFVVMEKKAK